MKIKSISLKKLSYILIIVYILSIVPMLLIGLYNYPSADDFTMGLEAHRAMLTGGPFAAIEQGIVKAWYIYTNWTGYFTSAILMNVPPSVFSEKLYPAGVIAVLVVYTVATCYFMQSLLHKMCGFDKDAVRCISMLVLIVSEQCMPGTSARVEMFYWYSGSSNYLGTYSLALLFFGFLISSVFENNNKKSVTSYVIAICLSFWIGGANYMTALTSVIVIVLSFIWRQLIRKGFIRNAVFKLDSTDPVLLKREKMIIVPGVLMLLGFAASCLAPGNNNRSELTSGMGAVKSILVSLHYTLSYPLSEWMNWAVLLLFAIMGIIIWKAVSMSDTEFRYPVIVTVVGYGLVSANITPCIYAQGNISAGRLHGLFWVQYVLVVTLVIWYLTGAVFRAIHENNHNRTREPILGNKNTAIIFCLALFFMFGSALQTAENHDFYTSTSAVEDLLNGHAQKYAEQNQQRRELLNDSSITNVELEPYVYKPDLLFFSDIEENPEDWQNIGVSRYYNKETVVRLP